MFSVSNMHSLCNGGWNGEGNTPAAADHPPPSCKRLYVCCNLIEYVVFRAHVKLYAFRLRENTRYRKRLTNNL